MSGRDYRDDCIEQLSGDVATLEDRVQHLAERAVSAEAERDALRMVAVAGLHHAHDLHVELVALRERYQRTVDDARSLRAQLIQDDGRRAAA